MERAQPRKITRNRELRACTQCRKRKLKCDRQTPCGSCVRRNEPTSCAYESRFASHGQRTERRSQAEARLEHLEQLIEELSSQNASSQHRSSVADSPMHLAVTDITTEPLYAGPTHWSAILDDIDELRDVIWDDDDVPEVEEGEGMTVLFGGAQVLSFEQVLVHFLPPRVEADRLVASYFRAKSLSAPFIHAGQFNRLYQAFWHETTSTAASPLWTAIMFSILDIASRAIAPTTELDDARSKTRFSNAAAQCLAIGQYHRPQRFAVEAVLLYAQARCITTSDISYDLAVLLGTICRLASAQGYHRDPAAVLNQFTPFDVEMRRRTWSLLLQLDILISFQLGLPTNVQLPTWDTRLPLNLLDSDFNETSVVLPDPRPETEHTELTFYIAKHRLMACFEKVYRHTLSPTTDAAILLELDQEVQTTYASLSNVYVDRAMSSSIVDTPSVIVTRLCVYFIHLKIVCVLHRKYAILGRRESTEICYNAASSLIQRFVDIDEQFETGGLLDSERWFMSSITWHDFLLACTVLCLTICSTKQPGPGLSKPVVDVASAISLLLDAEALFPRHAYKSKNTRKVQGLVRTMIVTFGPQSARDTSAASNVPLLPFGQTPTSTAELENRLSQGNSQGEMPMTNPMDDATWSYLEQFLDLPD